MADPTNIEALHATHVQAARQAVQHQMVRRLLDMLDPQPGDAHLDYRGLLQRVQTVIATELQQLGEEGHA
jgi:hypothetical protein